MSGADRLGQRRRPDLPTATGAPIGGGTSPFECFCSHVTHSGHQEPSCRGVAAAQVSGSRVRVALALGRDLIVAPRVAGLAHDAGAVASAARTKVTSVSVRRWIL